MDVIRKFEAAKKAKNVDLVINDLVTEDVHYVTPKWEAKGKSELKKQLAKEFSSGGPELSEPSSWEESGADKFTRTAKVKVAIMSVKIHQTVQLEGGKIKSMVIKKL
eukprot:TRINITY_DN10249_c0_g1_i7.p1 TRINITY_DN10249_c0_g1~~TRINITY_DN10249_c0_g1_i7.p1  ORF type:complete len:107 (+),score=28.92 TRINITY_DN10249_c0_g1_i7:74-394(+)